MARPAPARERVKAGRLLLALLLALALGGGCLTPRNWFATGSKDEAKSLVALFSYAQSDTIGRKLTRELLDPDGASVTVGAFPLLSPVRICNAAVVRNAAGERALELHLDRHGRMIWLQICAEFAGREVAVVVDGFYRFPFRIPGHAVGSRTVVIPGPWNATELGEIVAATPHNYRLLSKH